MTPVASRHSTPREALYSRINRHSHMHLGERSRLVGHPCVRRRWRLVALATIAGLSACARNGDVEGDNVAIGLAIEKQLPEMLSVRQGTELAISRLNDERPRNSRPFVLRLPPTSTTSAVSVYTPLRMASTGI